MVSSEPKPLAADASKIHNAEIKSERIEIKQTYPIDKPLESGGDNDLLLIPDDVAQYLAGGIEVDALVVDRDSGSKSISPFANATISYRDGSLELLKLELLENDVLLNPEIEALLLSLTNSSFDKNGILKVNDGIYLSANIETMEVAIYVPPSYMATKQVEKVKLLSDSSIDKPTSLLQYDINSNITRDETALKKQSYINFDNVSSWGKHHINTSGFISQQSDEQHDYDVDKLTYEYDSNGYRFNAGMNSGWSSLQTLGDVSTLNGQRVYGASFGNTAKSAKHDNRSSLLPVAIYMPSNGEVKVYRDGQLIDMQRLSMGNQELDTKDFPIGTYDVDVEVSIGGKVSYKRRYPINKPYISANANGELSWEFWGGAIEVNQYASEPQDGSMNYEQTTELNPLLGVSLASSWQGVQWTSTFYQNDTAQVAELSTSWMFNEQMSFTTKSLVASDGSVSGLLRTDIDLLEGAVNLWAASERSSIGEKLADNTSNNRIDSIGGALAVSNWIPYAGTIGLSYQQDYVQSSRSLSLDYSQSFDFDDWGSWTVQVGTNRQNASYDYGDYAVDQFYANLSVRLPLDGHLMFGISDNGDARTFNLSGMKDVDMGPVTYVGADVAFTKSDYASSTSYGVYAGYDTRYLQGSASYSGSEGADSVSLSGHGAIAIDDTGVTAGSGRGDAALVLTLPDDVEEQSLVATVNQASYTLDEGRNLIMVPAYDHYDVAVQSNLESDNAYQVEMSESAVTLYPGNVATLPVGVKQMITVFGRLTNADGSVLANASVRNHIGSTVTDGNGNFAIDVDSNFTEIVVEPAEVANSAKFKVEMSLTSENGMALLGDIVVDGPQVAHYTILPIG
ncbi:MAG: TcfC E-set like domain-containing protein [Shewanella sp.]